MIRRRSLLAPTLILVVLGFAGCSKTQDTAPGTRIFGRPPVIEGQPQLDATPSTVSCDFTEALDYKYRAQMLAPTVFGATFSHFKLTVKVSDPDSTDPGRKNDILLVSASYIVPGGGTTQNEITLVLFDDGSPIHTDAAQGLFQKQTADDPLDCSVAGGDGGVICNTATFQLVSGDAVMDDGIYSRNFAILDEAFAAGQIKKFVRDCVAMTNREWSKVSYPAGAVLSLRIDVVDRSGNLTTGPTLKYTTTAALGSCTGDPCACCVEAKGVSAATDENGACRGLPGVYGDGVITSPEGLCNQQLAN